MEIQLIYPKTYRSTLAAMGALSSLMVMNINIGVFSRFYDLLTSLGIFFLLIALVAIVATLPLHKLELRWIFILGTLIGFLGGFGIVLYATINI